MSPQRLSETDALQERSGSFPSYSGATSNALEGIDHHVELNQAAHNDEQSENFLAELPATTHVDDANLALWWLYASHLCRQFTDGAWQFCVVLLLLQLDGDSSLLWVSTYGLAIQVAVCVCTPITGRKWIDEQSKSRVFVVNCLILGAHGCVIASAASLLWLSPERLPLKLVLVHVLGMAEQVLVQTLAVAMERDWIVVISKGESSTLTSANVMTQRIDLACKVIAPAATGWIMATGDKSGSIYWIVGWSVLALMVELIATKKIPYYAPSLLTGCSHEEASEADDDHDDDTASQIEQEASASSSSSESGGWMKSIRKHMSSFGHLSVYFQQSGILWGGIALALLYCNILCFGGIMTAYLVSQGMSEGHVGIWRGVSCLMGLLGTAAFEYFSTRSSLETTGMHSLVYFLACLTICFASAFVSDTTISLVLLIAGVLPSRVGLWIYDIAVSQMMQERVPEGARGSVGGTQTSLNAMFSMLPYFLGIAYPRPDQFSNVFVTSGFASVALATLSYAFGLYLPYLRCQHQEDEECSVVHHYERLDDDEV